MTVEAAPGSYDGLHGAAADGGVGAGGHGHGLGCGGHALD